MENRKAQLMADAILHAAGSRFQHYIPSSRERITEVAAHELRQAALPYLAMIAKLLPYAEAHARASHLTDGFAVKPLNEHDVLVQLAKEMLA